MFAYTKMNHYCSLEVSYCLVSPLGTEDEVSWLSLTDHWYDKAANGEELIRKSVTLGCAVEPFGNKCSPDLQERSNRRQHRVLSLISLTRTDRILL